VQQRVGIFNCEGKLTRAMGALLMKKSGEGWPVIVNRNPTKDSVLPAPTCRGGTSRDDRRFRPCRKGPLFTPNQRK